MLKATRIKIINCINQSMKPKGCSSKVQIYSDGREVESQHSKQCRDRKRLQRIKAEKYETTRQICILKEKPIVQFGTDNPLNPFYYSYDEFCDEFKRLTSNPKQYYLNSFEDIVNRLNLKFWIKKLLCPVRTMNEEIKQVYRECFENFSVNKTMSNYVDNNINIAYFEAKEFAGCATFKLFTYEGKQWANLILLGVKESYRRMGIGEFILDYLKGIADAVALYSDNEPVKVKYYRERGFKQDKVRLNNGLWRFVMYESNAVFMIYEKTE